MEVDLANLHTHLHNCPATIVDPKKCNVNIFLVEEHIAIYKNSQNWYCMHIAHIDFIFFTTCVASASTVLVVFAWVNHNLFLSHLNRFTIPLSWVGVETFAMLLLKKSISKISKHTGQDGIVYLLQFILGIYLGTGHLCFLRKLLNV